MEWIEQISDSKEAKPVLQKRLIYLNILPIPIFGLPTLALGLSGFDERYLWILALISIPSSINVYLSIRDGYFIGAHGIISERKKGSFDFWTDALIYIFFSLIFLAIAIIQEVQKIQG